ncbi:MAG TPA: NAD-dependent epimerase/dehydratase family protein [bacterium]|nr:NAD-dependent epimerase/dehydratase family protein [bacterium]
MDGKSILITGGSGSFGNAFARYALDSLNPRRVIVFSRDEFKQFEMQKRFPDPRMRFFIGDVRDERRMRTAFRGVDIVIHAAALKCVPIGEIHPTEFNATNIIGTENVIEACRDAGVDRAVLLSTDKAVMPVNHYGVTKANAEHTFISSNLEYKTKFSVVRYGNIVGSRGSVIPLFLEMARDGEILITDYRMTRFVMELSEAVKLVKDALKWMTGGEIFIPKLESVRIGDLARIIGGASCKYRETGIRAGEKLVEWLISPEEVRKTVEFEGVYQIIPETEWYKPPERFCGTPLDMDFIYNSENTKKWVSDERLRQIISDIKKSAAQHQ